MLNKIHLIECIQQVNQSAQRDWLDLFDVVALKRYLDHLNWMLDPRVDGTPWERPNETPAILTRRPVD